MTEASKLTLSAEELQLVTNTGWILTKRAVMDKVSTLLGAQAAFAQQLVQQCGLPQAVKNTSPKIAKGENYRQLPWIMLDYPRLFEKENVFAIRTFFWWGHFFSVTLHLSGDYKNNFQQKLLRNFDVLQQHHFFIGVNSSAWEHHFEPDNYLTAAALSQPEAAALFEKAVFIKIACKHPLQQWNQLPGLLQQSYTRLLQLLED